MGTYQSSDHHFARYVCSQRLLRNTLNLPILILHLYTMQLPLGFSWMHHVILFHVVYLPQAVKNEASFGVNAPWRATRFVQLRANFFAIILHYVFWCLQIITKTTSNLAVILYALCLPFLNWLTGMCILIYEVLCSRVSLLFSLFIFACFW